MGNSVCGGAIGSRGARAQAMLSENIGSGAGAAFENQYELKMAAEAGVAIAEGDEFRFCYATPKSLLLGIARSRPSKARG